MKVAIVTGSATGMGRACAVELSKAGFTVAANYRSKRGDAESLLEDLHGEGHKLFQGDISVPEEAEQLIIEVIVQLGRVDALVNAAGQYTEQDVISAEYDNWRKAWHESISINLLAPMNLCFHAAREMIKNGGGKVVNITSRGAFRGEPDAPAYGASKSALNSASQSLAVALAPHGVCVYAIAPGYIDTPMASPAIHGEGGEFIKAQSPLNRVGRPSEIAKLVTYLLGEDTEYLTGAIIDMNGASYLRN